MSIEGVGRGGGNVDAVNAILQQATQKSVEAAEKLMKFAVGQTVGAEAGKGGNFDAMA
jgi:hypothetical protein